MLRYCIRFVEMRLLTTHDEYHKRSDYYWLAPTAMMILTVSQSTQMKYVFSIQSKVDQCFELCRGTSWKCFSFLINNHTLTKTLNVPTYFPVLLRTYFDYFTENCFHSFFFVICNGLLTSCFLRRNKTFVKNNSYILNTLGSNQMSLWPNVY